MKSIRIWGETEVVKAAQAVLDATLREERAGRDLTVPGKSVEDRLQELRLARDERALAAQAYLKAVEVSDAS